ncbi:MAG: acetate--CoA ligase family protein [Rhodospirillales bacterium]|nr:acetate--CoA ligase family protein [Rhodospirillales bacterium]
MSMQANLTRLLRPRQIAFVGSIQSEGSIAACRRAGYAGEMWTVSPNRDEIGGIPCVREISDLPEAPDVALLALSPERTVAAIKALGEMGAGGAVCMSAGYAEMNEDGARIQQQLIEHAGDMVVLGPNCMGMINMFDGAAVWGADNFMERPGNPNGKGCAIISQSGAFVFGITNVEQAFPLGYGISTGNQVMLSVADIIHGVLDDERVNAIGIYLEGLDDGNALGVACNRAREMGVPLIAIKGGNTPAGAVVAKGHTASMVVDSDIWQAFTRRYGIAQVSSPKAMVEALKLLSVCGVPAGPRLAAITYSGGLNGMIVSDAPGLGIELHQPTPENRERLIDRLPETVPVANPLDLTLPFRSSTVMAMDDIDGIAQTFVDLASDSADLVAMIMDVPRAGLGMDKPWLPSVDAMIKAREQTGLPCVVAGILPEGLDVNLRKHLLAGGVAPLCGYDDAMKAFSAAAACAKTLSRPTAAPALMSMAGTPASGTPQMLDEQESKALLEGCGMPLPRRWVGTAEDAPAAADDLGYPVVVKILSDQIAHKDQMGGVKLNLQTAEAVAGAVAEITAAVAGTVSNPQFLVEQMVTGGMCEFIIGLKRDIAMGLVMMVGQGGTETEAKANFVTLLMPLTDTDVDEALECLHARDATGLRTAIEAVATFADQHGSNIIELDVNPVIVTTDGNAVAVDALAVLLRGT